MAAPRTRIRDFFAHAVAFLIAEVIELHDRARFEITAFSFSPRTGDYMQERLKRSFDRYIDVRDRSGVTQVVFDADNDAVIAGAVWFFFLRGGGSSSTPATAGSSTVASSTGTTGTTGTTGAAAKALGRHFIALLKDGTIRIWGNTDWGQGGVGIAGTEQATPAAPKISGVKAVFAAGNSSFAIREDNSAWIWGAGYKWPEGPEWPLAANAKTPVPLTFSPVK